MKNKIDLNGKTILVTGGAGFIGANLILRLLQDENLMKTGTIVSLDNMNDYYDVALKEYRLSLIESAVKTQSSIKYIMIKGSVADKALVESIFHDYKVERAGSGC